MTPFDEFDDVENEYDRAIFESSEESDDYDDDGQGELEPDPEADEPEQKNRFQNVYEFVENHFRYIYARKLDLKNDRRWCPRWFEHPEAVSRLEAVWRAWESAGNDPGAGVSNWYRDHADYHMAVLLDPTGPFEGCSVRGHKPDLAPQPLPVDIQEDQTLRALMSVYDEPKTTR